MAAFAAAQVLLGIAAEVTDVETEARRLTGDLGRRCYLDDLGDAEACELANPLATHGWAPARRPGIGLLPPSVIADVQEPGLTLFEGHADPIVLDDEG